MRDGTMDTDFCPLGRVSRRYMTRNVPAKVLQGYV